MTNVGLVFIFLVICFGFFALYKAHKEDIKSEIEYRFWYNHPNQIWDRFKHGDYL